MNNSDEVWKAKNALREYAGARRRLAHRLTGPGAGVRAADHFLANIPVAPGTIISGYWPIREEFDDMAILRRMSAAGYRCALPYVDKKRHVLVFREWQPGAAMIAGPFQIPEPAPEAAELSPTILPMIPKVSGLAMVVVIMTAHWPLCVVPAGRYWRSARLFPSRWSSACRITIEMNNWTGL